MTRRIARSMPAAAARLASVARLAAAALALAGALAAPITAAARPAAKRMVVVVPKEPPAVLPPVARDERLPEGYGDLVKRITRRGPADTLGDGLYAQAEAAFYAGDFDAATQRYQEFAQKFVRNLRVNDALDRILVIRESRDFDDGPLKLWARAESCRHDGKPDSVATLLRLGLERYPGAALRYRFHLALAELARDRGDHASALTQALAVADTSVTSRLAPYALKMAGDETLAMGGPPDRAMGYYQSLLERFPDSPLAPGVRAQLLAMRKKMQL